MNYKILNFLFSFSFFWFVGISQPQNYSLANDSRSVLGVLNNPANTSSDSNNLLKLHIFSFEGWGGGSSSSLRTIDLISIDNNFFREKILGTNNVATGWGGFNINGPSASISTVDNKFSFGLTTRLRLFANYWDIDGRLVSEIEEDDKINQAYPYNLVPNTTMRLNTMAWSDLGLSFSMQLYKKKGNILKGGVNLHYLTGLSHASIDAHFDKGTVKDFGSNNPYLTSSTGTISTVTSGDLYNNPTLGKLFKTNMPSVGLDVGFVYDHTPKVPGNGRRLKIGVSILDIGKVNFAPDPQYSKNYDINIRDIDYLFFTNDFHTPINRVSIPLDTFPNFFKQKNVYTQSYSIALPTSLHIDADVQVKNAFFVNAALATGLQPKSSVTALYSYQSIFITPRFEQKRYSLQVPLSYQSYTGFNAGLAGRFGPVYVGMASFFSGMVTKSKQFDGYAGVQVLIKKRSKTLAKIAPENIAPATAYREGSKKIVEIAPVTAPTIPVIKNNLHAFIEAQSVNTTHGIVPFWMRSNQYGSIPLSGISTSLLGRVEKTYDTVSKGKKIDWSGAVEARINGGNKAEAILIEAYAKGRYGIFEMKVGRSKDIVGTVDPDLSSGSFSISGNTLGIPKVQLSIPQYVSIIGKGFFSMKASVAHGWVGTIPLYGNNYLDSNANTYYHQATIYGRLGRPNSKFKAYAGVNHEVFWGNEKKFSPQFQLSLLEEYFYVVVGRPYQSSKVGNHIGTIDISADYDFKSVKISAYHQFFYDAGALFHLANLRDGLTGLSVLNKQANNRNGFFWHKFLAEFMYSVNQAGQLDSRITNSGDEDYYHNATYRDGWSYKGNGLGTPFITPNKYARTGLPYRSNEFFINNRVSLFHLGFIGSLKKWDISTKLSYSHNFGTYATSPIGNSLGNIRTIGPPPYFTEVDQFSGYLEAAKMLKKGYRIGIVGAIDAGGLLYNSQGLILKLAKTW